MLPQIISRLILLVKMLSNMELIFVGIVIVVNKKIVVIASTKLDVG